MEADCIALPDDFMQYDGKRVIIAAYGSDLSRPSDVTGALYGARATNPDLLRA